MAEAEAEAMAVYPDIAETLRQARKRMEMEPEWIPILLPIISEISKRVKQGNGKQACDGSCAIGEVMDDTRFDRIAGNLVARNIKVEIETRYPEKAAKQLRMMGVQIRDVGRRKLKFEVPSFARRKVKKWMEKNGFGRRSEYPKTYPALFASESSKRRVKMSMREKVAKELVAVAKILAGCEKLPEGPMRDNCEKKKKEGEKSDKKEAGCEKLPAGGMRDNCEKKVDEGKKNDKDDKKKDAAWEPVRKDVDIRMRNKEVVKSLSSFAPRISASMRKKATTDLLREGYDVAARSLKREWSQYLAFIDPDQNSNKYHYYVVYSFLDSDGEPMYVGWNCSGRIGIIERAYDLTDKYAGGPTYRLNQAIAACEKHLNTKKRKGYEPMKMTRG
jgi:predicted DNA-binding WGR domain protein